MATQSTTPATWSWQSFLVGIVVGGGAVMGAIVLGEQHGEASASKPNKGPGYYVVLFNEPVGTINSRYKGMNGPFLTQGEALQNVNKEKHVWYPKIYYAKSAKEAVRKADTESNSNYARLRAARG
jgi:hypothetical protein